MKMGMPRFRRAHPSRTFVNSNWGKLPDPSPFSSPGSLKLAFRRAIAFCNRQDQRSYAQVLSYHCDSPFHKSGKWSGSSENSYLVNSTSSVCGQYSKKTQHFGGSKAAVLYKNCKQVCLSDVKPDPACSADGIVLQNYGCNQDNGKVGTLSHVGDTLDSSHNRKLVSPTVGQKSTDLSEIPLSNRFEVLATNSDVNSDIHSTILLQNQLFDSQDLQRSVCSDDRRLLHSSKRKDRSLAVGQFLKGKTLNANITSPMHPDCTRDNVVLSVHGFCFLSEYYGSCSY